MTIQPSQAGSDHAGTSLNDEQLTAISGGLPKFIGGCPGCRSGSLRFVKEDPRVNWMTQVSITSPGMAGNTLPTAIGRAAGPF
jgi:hypothetical protein